MFGNSKHAANGANGTAQKPSIRRETVRVPVRREAARTGEQRPNPAARAPAPTNRFQLSKTPSAKPKIAATPPKKPQAPVQRAKAESRGLKRKSATPERVVFSDDESDDSDIGISDSDMSRKRLKSSASTPAPSSLDRYLVSEVAFEKSDYVDFVHGADCTTGEHARKFKNPWEAEEFDTVELQYPALAQRERFELKWPKKEKDDYKPMEDIIETIKHIADFYFPDELREKYTNEETGFGRRFTRSWLYHSISDFKAIVEDFNSILKTMVDDGTIKTELAKKRQLPLPLVQRILDQIYSRTVSPKVETLRAYENGTDNVYGELLNRFCSDIFRQTKMNANQVFVDLGSGVGNVVLQAALEVGCESWGIEMMKNPCDLADLQAKEFPGRTHLWGVKAGNVNLIRGDFTDNPKIIEVLKRADIVLVNNQAFTPALNSYLLGIFLELKDGCQIVSLKPFVQHKINNRQSGSIENVFVQQQFTYYSGSVSWTDAEGSYYIATKDATRLREFETERRRR